MNWVVVLENHFESLIEPCDFFPMKKKKKNLFDILDVRIFSQQSPTIAPFTEGVSWIRYFKFHTKNYTCKRKEKVPRN